ncbi:MAG: mechanosensitive ion channel family protein [Acidobacteria bacterium]|nr:mechanosensitive ion channel family protein [Acidobacteriota bacterium]
MNFFEEDILAELHRSAPHIIKNLVFVILYFIGGYIFIKLFKKFIDRISKSIIEKQEAPSPDFEARVKTISVILKRVSEFAVFIIVVLTALSQMGVAIGPLLAGLGIVGVAVGFGAQYLIKDLIAGFFIILEDQIRVGEFVKIDSSEGIVETITLRTTKLRSLGGQIFIIPNGQINIITNMSRDFIRAVVEIDLPYEVSPEIAFDVLKEAADEVQKDENFKKHLLEEIEIQGITAFGSSSLKYRILAKMSPKMGRIDAESKIRNCVIKTLRKRNISIPYQQIDVHIENKGD